MSVEDSVYAAMTGGRRRPAEDESLNDLLREIREAGGSGRASARLADIAPTSWRRYERGEAKPRAANLAKIVRAVRTLRMAADAPTDTTVEIHTQDRQDGRQRTIDARQLRIRPGTMSRVREAYLAGDDKGAAVAFLAGIGDRWYRGWLTPGSELAQTGVEGEAYGGPEKRAAFLRAHADDEDAEEYDEEHEEEVTEEYEEEYEYEYEDYDTGDIDTDYGATVNAVGRG